jgi:hypothetical protein
MNKKLTTPAMTTPVTLSEAKAQLRLLATFTIDDE